jgi:hypothetical protein
VEWSFLCAEIKMSSILSWLRGCCACLVLGLLVGTSAHAADAPVFKDEELDQMLAPIALYPDSLLSQVLMASTYPADVADAAKYVKAHPDDKGEAAVTKVQADPQGKDWDPSVQSLVAFPQVLAMMGEKPDQVQRLGDAFLADPKRVLDRVQFLRKKAQEAGNLKTTEQQKVTTTTQENKQVIVIEPAQPNTVYVPVYQPTVVYGPWWYPSYPPYYWPPPPYYYPTGGFVAGVFWGAAIVGVGNAIWGGANWGRGDVDIDINRYNNINVNNKINNGNFQHNADRRRDVPYRDQGSRDKYGRQSAGAQDRQAYRGNDSRDAQRAQASQQLSQRGADPAASRERLQTTDRAAAQQAIDRGGADRGAAGAGSRDLGGAGGAGTRDAGGARASTADRGGSSFGSASASNNAFSGASRPDASRAQASRGSASAASMNRSAPSRPAGGGGMRGGGGRR